MRRAARPAGPTRPIARTPAQCWHARFCRNAPHRSNPCAVLARTFFSPSAFSKPGTRTEWLNRLRANVTQYWNFYFVLFVVVLVYTVLSSPLLLFGLALLGAAWAYAFLQAEATLAVFGFELRRREKLIVLVPFSLLVVALCGMINSLTWVIFVTGTLSLPCARPYHPSGRVTSSRGARF